jgi:hypothetical protein
MWMPVRTKQDFVRRYKLGEFGNHAPTWDTAVEYYNSGYQGMVHIRNRVAGGMTWYNVDPFTFSNRWNAAARHYGETKLYISAMAPTEQTLFQGELVRGLRGLNLTYSIVAKPMRDALHEQSRFADGALSLFLLQRYLDTNSYNWLQVLVERYPDHAIEFSTYSVQWGTLPRYNTVFWEVRLY